MDQNELTDRVKHFALENDVDYARIAPVSRFENAPEGHKPADFLPGAQSVISIGIRLTLGVQLAHRMGMANRKFRHVAFSYRWFGYGLLNMYFLDRAAFRITRFLEKEGYVAVPIVASGVEAGEKLLAPFSNRHAAVAAGHGEFGWNNLCITPESGPRVRFCSIITTAKLNPDPLYQGPKICDLEKCRELGDGRLICMKVCPVNAFGNEPVQKVVMGTREFTYPHLEKMKCVTMGLQFSKKALGLRDIKLPPVFDERITAMVEKQIHPQQTMEASFYFGRSHGCGMCLLLCPVQASEVVDKTLQSLSRTWGDGREHRWI